MPGLWNGVGAGDGPTVAVMTSGARTPEELETLLEDAFITRDRAGFRALFDEGAVLAQAGAAEARGPDAIARVGAQLWDAGRTYVGGVARVLQARATALVVAPAGIHVARRAGDGTWRVAIALLDPPPTSHPGGRHDPDHADPAADDHPTR